MHKFALRIKSIKFGQGVVYHHGDVVVINNNITLDFAEICEILLVGSTKVPVFICKKLLTERFNYHMHAYKVTRSETHIVIKLTHLLDHHTYSLYSIDTHGTLYISLKYHIMET